MISSTAQYALRSIVLIARNGDGYLNRSNIAEGTLVPFDYLLKVLGELESAGIVESKRGPGGGYRLATEPQDLTVLKVVKLFNGLGNLKECPMSGGLVKDCPLGDGATGQLCPLHQMLSKVNSEALTTFENTTISDLIKQPKKP